MLRFGPYPIIGICFCVSYNRFTVNNESGRQGQCPGIICVVSGQVDVELQINGSQIFRHGMHQPELPCDLVARIAENFKCQIFELFQGAAEFGNLGRNSDQVCPLSIELFNVALQSLQLNIAIRSPAATVKDQNHGPLRQNIFRAHHPAFCVLQRKMRCSIADF